MKELIIKDEKNRLIADSCRKATSFFSRARGLLFTPPLEKGEGIWIEPCSSVHTFFMSYPIDVVFVSDKNIIIHIITNMKPWRLSRIIPKARAVLELPAGTAEEMSLETGDYLKSIE